MAGPARLGPLRPSCAPTLSILQTILTTKALLRRQLIYDMMCRRRRWCFHSVYFRRRTNGCTGVRVMPVVHFRAWRLKPSDALRASTSSGRRISYCRTRLARRQMLSVIEKRWPMQPRAPAEKARTVRKNMYQNGMKSVNRKNRRAIRELTLSA